MKAVLTTYDEINEEDHEEVEVSRQGIINHLENDPENAVVIVEVDGFKLDPPQAIIRGASGEPEDYSYGNLPLEDPNDFDGPHTAAKAVRKAIETASFK